MKRNLKEIIQIPFIRHAISRYNDNQLMICYKSCVDSINRGLFLNLNKKDKRRFIIYKTLVFNEVTERKLLKGK